MNKHSVSQKRLVNKANFLDELGKLFCRLPKNNCVAYYEAQKPQGKRGPGRPPTYGKKVTLTDFFDQLHLFSQAQCCVYNKMEEISFMTINLLWKPTGRLIRFVLAITSRGPIVLMCTLMPICALVPENFFQRGQSSM